MSALPMPLAQSASRREAMPCVLGLQNIESSYGPVKAIRGVSLQVHEGEIATVLGSNGAGKTTILKTISGIIDPRKGQVHFLGRDVTACDPAAIVRQGLVHVPEGREVFPLLNVHDNLLMGAYTRGDRDGVARDMETVLGYFPVLRERLRQQAGLLSGGQQQMLAIGRAIIGRPRLILLDEPSLGLAPLVVQDIFAIIERINREQDVAILVVEQNAHVALKVAHYGYIMENGRIVINGPTEKLVNDPDVQRFYLGAGEEGKAHTSFRDVKHYKRRKRWLS